MPAVTKTVLNVSALAFVAGSMVLAASASADTTVIPNMTLGINGSQYNPAEYGDAWGNPNGTFSFIGQKSNPGYKVAWSMTVNPDPFVIANLVVTNNSAVTQTFSLLVSLPVGAILPTSVMGGSITGTLTDLNGNGASLTSVAGDSVYHALIDNNTVETLMDDPFSVSAGAFESAVVGPASFGDPIPSAPGPGVNNSIGILITFNLSAGDSASFTSIFVVQVPGPGGLALLAVAGAIGGRRRRRS
jgi:MYXO-CTERM domain-containing protein